MPRGIGFFTKGGIAVVMTAYPNDDKQMYLDRVRAHRAADELVRGHGWDMIDGKRLGCAVGCTLNTYDHSKYPELLGVPEQLAYLEDFIFENLPSCHMDWPERFLSAIRPGADLSGVWPAWVRRMLQRRLEKLGDGDESWRRLCREAIRRVRDIYEHGMPSQDDAMDAAWAARAADWAARAARDAEITLMANDLIELLQLA